MRIAFFAALAAVVLAGPAYAASCKDQITGLTPRVKSERDNYRKQQAQKHFDLATTAQKTGSESQCLNEVTLTWRALQGETQQQHDDKLKKEKDKRAQDVVDQRKR